jgi:TRAP-type C4-dicarboxylate transport system substrate-binding protein
MKKILFSLLMVTLLIGTAMVGWSQTTSKPIELNFAIADPPIHYEVKGVYAVWAREVEKRTGGRVKITLYPGQTLGKQGEQYDLIGKCHNIDNHFLNLGCVNTSITHFENLE